MAASWLETSRGNPRWKGKMYDYRKVKAIRDDILAGRWHPGNNSVAFDTEGVLVDGHHRLKAIVEAKVTVPCLVVLNLPPESLKHIDDNSARKPSQALGVNIKFTSLTNLHVKIVDGYQTASSNERIAAFLAEYSMELAAVEPLFGLKGTSGLARNAPFYYAVFSAYVNGVDLDTLTAFAQGFATGFTAGAEESAAIAIRNQLLLHPSRTIGERVAAAKNIEAAIRDYVAKKPRKNPYKMTEVVYPVSDKKPTPKN